MCLEQDFQRGKLETVYKKRLELGYSGKWGVKLPKKGGEVSEIWCRYYSL